MKRFLCMLVLVSLLVMVDFSTAQGEALPDSAYVYGVIGHAQGYSISCESRSAADLAGFWGVYIGETEFLQALPRSDNPNQGFVGNPNEIWGRTPPHGYGVHAEPIAATLREFGLKAEARRGLSWDDLRYEISAGRPVIVWVIGAMWSGTPMDYVSSDGSTSRVAAFEHTFLLTGYSANGVEVIDAYSGQYQYYWLSSFLDSWSVLGNMAVFATGGGQQVENSGREIQGNTYPVQPGDYLMQLARDFGVSWLELAQMNSIGYPYFIYTGQVLQLPGGISHPEEAEPIAELPSTQTITSTTTLRYRANLPIVAHLSDTQSSPSMGTSSTSQEPSKTVIVLHTDTLIGFGRSIGVSWHVLAELNNLDPMHILHPGEILKVK